MSHDMAQHNKLSHLGPRRCLQEEFFKEKISSDGDLKNKLAVNH